jgi:hypothetical protein
MHGTAKQTSGGLTKKDLKYNKRGEIVSKKKSANMKKGSTWKKRFGKKLAKPFTSKNKTMKVKKTRKVKQSKSKSSRK